MLFLTLTDVTDEGYRVTQLAADRHFLGGLKQAILSGINYYSHGISKITLQIITGAVSYQLLERKSIVFD